MGYGCYVKGGTIYVDESKAKEAVKILAEDCFIDSEEVKPGEIEIYSSLYGNYHEEDYQRISEIAKEGSHVEFLGDDDAVWTLYLHDGKIEDHCGVLVYDDRELDKVRIPLGNGFSLVAEKNSDPDYKEIIVYLYDDEEGIVHQDLAVIGEEYTFEGDKVTPLHDVYSVKVYADSNNEDFTDDFRIERYKEGENNV